ncbi:hypothetical protein COY90_03990 [Candidatus Roizmanbacteria bacterium CG_4_10_14_0_8_um_filter_39_9]|uniref:DUF2207 domain-containing protein n=1 Tax=Candidatus Roizmanbacteria bacterium CG_4_10_14_0_8_um_filter_39_9 TaxID=1974829 RepID=A0A2M7QDH1_9BACT|nr:MAG: hypothetical protein COY90_03990 [Candidatus Roizmanbacteria bacterium CG_4_10_14_0_8_um_filter_39_9]
MKKNLFLSIFFSFCFIFLIPSIIQAQAEEIKSFNTTVRVNTDATINVEEKIVYDFGDLEKHGIFRDIPYITVNADGKRYKMDIGQISVTKEDGTPYSFSTSTVNDDLRVKIGDANVLITGVNTYLIQYTVGGALTYYSDHDELYWNMTGDKWDVPIGESSFDVVLPTLIAKDSIQMKCFTGSHGQSSSDCSYKTGSAVSGKSSVSLGAKQGLTGVVGFPKGVVAVLESQEVVRFEDTLSGKILLFLLGVLVFVWYIGLPLGIPIYWWFFGRDPKALIGEVRAWYDPPSAKDGRRLTPSETGVLVDESVDTRDIFACVIDLARRGYLKIVEEKKGSFCFVKQKESMNDATLQKFEKELLDRFFGETKGEDKVYLKTKNLSTPVEKVKDILYTTMTSTGFFPSNPNTVRTIWYAVAGVAFFTGNILLTVVAFIFGRVMPRKTVYGAGQANIGKSLKNFLKSQERQLEFQAKNQQFFEKLLPFAVAFGVEKVWAERFKDINMRNPDWYQGYDNRSFTSAYLISSMHSSFNSFNTSVTPVRSSTGHSSGFSSGGFSGGGGGGGGGGSW